MAEVFAGVLSSKYTSWKRVDYVLYTQTGHLRVSLSKDYNLPTSFSRRRIYDNPDIRPC